MCHFAKCHTVMSYIAIYLQYFQLKTAWKSSSIMGVSMLINKRSQFTKIFSQAILDMKDTGRYDIFLRETSHQRNQSCNLPDQKEKPLGYTKLAFLFAMLASGTFISLFIALFEFFGKKHQIQKKEKYTTTIHKRNSIDESIKEILNDMSKDEIEKTFQRILQNLNQDSREVST